MMMQQMTADDSKPMQKSLIKPQKQPVDPEVQAKRDAIREARQKREA